MNNKMFIGGIAVIVAGVLFAGLHNCGTIKIKKQGVFAAGGENIVHSGKYDNQYFAGWGEQKEDGQSYHANHAIVDYQIPVHANKYPLIFVHGFGGSGTSWTMTPDGRDGFATLMLKHKYPTYVMDLPGRGQAGRTTNTATIKPNANEMFWFDIWRFGEYPNWNDGVQAVKSDDYFRGIFVQMTPDLSNGAMDVPAISATVDKVGYSVLVTHSAGGVTGWLAAMANDNVRGVASYEPGGFVFPDDDLPAAIDGKTGGTAPIPVPREQFMKLTQIPIVMYFGDYIPTDINAISDKLGAENWRVRLAMARTFCDAINTRGGNCTLVELPKIGIYGNTHFLMQDLNNGELADLLDKWLKKNKLR